MELDALEKSFLRVLLVVTMHWSAVTPSFVSYIGRVIGPPTPLLMVLFLEKFTTVVNPAIINEWSYLLSYGRYEPPRKGWPVLPIPIVPQNLE
jgi:hypothetical protein